MTTNITIEVETALPAGEAEQIIRALVGYNVTQAPPANHRTLAVVARRAGEVVGGLLGYTHWEWLFVQQLWSAEELRGSGVGRRLMLAAEAEARARGCHHAHLDTYSFQALGFYQRLGYRVFGQLEDYPAGHTRYFLHKRDLTAPNPPLDRTPPAGNPGSVGDAPRPQYASLSLFSLDPRFTALKKSTIALLSIAVVAILFGGTRWWSWSHGRVLASTDAGREGRAVIREIPYTTNVIYWLSDSSGYIYRMELWRSPHIMTDCKTLSEDSYRAKSARIDYAAERCIFYLDDRPSLILTARGDWTHE